MIPIYKHEKSIAEQIQASANLSFASLVREVEPSDVSEVLKAQQVTAEANPNQFDLFYLEAILVTTGWNGNSDVFSIPQAWAAKDTPVDKQFNFGHDEKDIIGHITSSKVVDFDGNIITEMPNCDFDIVVGSVLYKTWSNKELQERMNEIIAGIEEGKWFVSMECLFADFDYAIVTPKGENKVIARNDSSSFLTQHLKQYGGSGEYQGHKLGRLLKDYGFSGKGLVEDPANPRSFITNFNEKQEISSFAASAALDIDETPLDNKEKNMADISQAQYDELKKERDVLKSQIAKAEAEALEAKETAVTDLEKTVAEQKESIDKMISDAEASSELIKAKDEKIESLESELKEAKESIAKMEEEKEEELKKDAEAKRLNQLLAKNITEERAKELIEKFTGSSEEMFAALVETLPEKKVEAEETPSKEEVEAENLEDVQEEADADLNVGENEAEGEIEKASAWLQTTLRSNKKE